MRPSFRRVTDLQGHLLSRRTDPTAVLCEPRSCCGAVGIRRVETRVQAASMMRYRCPRVLKSTPLAAGRKVSELVEDDARYGRGPADGLVELGAAGPFTKVSSARKRADCEVASNCRRETSLGSLYGPRKSERTLARRGRLRPQHRLDSSIASVSASQYLHSIASSMAWTYEWPQGGRRASRRI